MATFYVSSHGDDGNPGNLNLPFLTLDRAYQAAKCLTIPTSVYLFPGTYTRTETWNIGSSSEQEPMRNRITFEAHSSPSSDDVVISGARKIDSWFHGDSSDIWKANIGDLDIRQLYVNNVKAEIAGIQDLPGTWTRTPTGYSVNTVISWASPSSIEFVYRGIYPWTEARCTVAELIHDGDSTIIHMAQPAWDRALKLYNFCWGGTQQHGPSTPTHIENSTSFLQEPGTFVCDRTCPGQHILYYKPRPGETLATTRITAPALEQLVNITGTANVTFRGITFADAAWLRPKDGFLHYHGDSHYVGEGSVNKFALGEGSWVMVPSKTDRIPGSISMKNTADTSFENCNFTRLGGTAFSSDCCKRLQVLHCGFESLSASGITLNGTTNAVVEDTTIQKVGLDYLGSPAIWMHNTSHCRVSHNNIFDTPHSGISLGPSIGSRITHNMVCRTMSRLADGGGINLAGCQGESMETGASLSGNVVLDTLTPYNFAIYADYGAKWVTIKENVVMRCDEVVVFNVQPPLEHVVFENNFWDKEPTGTDSIPEKVIYRANVVISDEGEIQRNVQRVIAVAGVRAGT